MRPRSIRILLALALLATGCVPDVPTQILADWELEVDGEHERVHLPAHLGHGLTEHETTYHLRTEVSLPPEWRGHDVTLGIPFLRDQIALFVDGHEVPSLDEHFFDHQRPMTPQRYRIGPDDTTGPTMSLDLRVRNGWAQASILDIAPRLALSPYGDRWTRIVRLFNVGTALFSVASMFTLALVFLLLHLTSSSRGRVDPKNTDFAQLAFGTGIYASTQLGLAQPLLGRRDLGLVYVAIVIATRASLQLGRRYNGAPPLPLWTGWFVLASIPTTIFFSDGFMKPIWSLGILGALAALLFYLVATTVRALRSGPKSELLWMIACWIVTATCGCFDIATAVGLGSPLQGLQLTCVALFLFLFTQALILSRDHSKLLVEQVTLNRELQGRVTEAETRNREIETLNVELRRKVGDRSRELATALRRVHTSGGLPFGTLLADRYRVTALLGRGAMGEVYRVERLSDGRAMAAKVVQGRPGVDTLERFTREAELAARIDHPNVVRIVDMDVTLDGELFLVMELVMGRSLEDERARFGDLAFARSMLAQIAAALAAIHGAGVVHRDLKPSNVLLTEGDDPIAKVADFGIAGGRGPMPISAGAEDQEIELDATMDAPTSSPQLTQAGAIMGTPRYMAPEVYAGAASIGLAADLFSFGLIAYEMLGGDVPPHGFRTSTPLPFSALQPTLAPALLDSLSRCLEVDPTRRPVASEIATLLQGEQEA